MLLWLILLFFFIELLYINDKLYMLTVLVRAMWDRILHPEHARDGRASGESEPGHHDDGENGK